MMIAETYASLSRLMEYPERNGVLQIGIEWVSRALQEQGYSGHLAPFAQFVTNSTLATLQEEYVAAFDFNPSAALYLGHHLYGDNQKKGLYMIKIKQEFNRYGFTPPRNELPDHLPLLLEFLAHLARQEEDGVRRVFISDCVLPGIERLTAGFTARKNSPWKPVVEASRLVCAADTTISKEATKC
jgi:nitrate reductase molybdenum cofactor assembly chaperone NarJ/NarW